MLNFVGAMNFLGIYFISIVLAFVFGAFGMMNPRRKKIYLIIFFSWMAFLAAFRAYYVGNDTPGYLMTYLNIELFDNPFDFIQRDGMEPGFVLFTWLITRFTSDPQALLIISSVFIYILTGRFVYKHVKNPGLFCCLFVGILQIDFFMSAVRQSMAIAIILFAFDFIVEKKPFKYIMVCLFAMTFHYTSALLLILYPILNFDNTKRKDTIYKLIWLAVVAIASFFFDNLISLVLLVFPRYSSYLAAETFDGVPRMALILKILVYGLLYIIPKFLKMRARYTDKGDVLNERLSFVNLCILIIAMNAVALARFSSTFSFFVTTYYANEILKTKKDDYFILLLLTLVAFGLYGFTVVYLKTPDWTTTFPIDLIFE